MSYTVRDGISFCMIGDRAIFLDVPQDRYFCLPADLEREFAELIAGRAELRDCPKLQTGGLIVRNPGNPCASPCLAPTITGAPDLLDDLARARAIATAEALLRITATSWRLRRWGFASLLHHFGRHKMRARKRPQNDLVVRSILSAHVATRLLLASQDRCLVRSFALAHHLLRVGQHNEVVLAVQLQPFQAHCWVQIGDRLINERLEVAREFTPILVL